MILLSRVYDEEGRVIHAGEVQRTQYQVISRNTAEILAAGDVITPQYEDHLVTNDPRWTVDDIGYNVFISMPLPGRIAPMVSGVDYDMYIEVTLQPGIPTENPDPGDPQHWVIQRHLVEQVVI